MLIAGKEVAFGAGTAVRNGRSPGKYSDPACAAKSPQEASMAKEGALGQGATTVVEAGRKGGQR
ncbi:MAG TPA: hypothetical protein VKC57_13895, partial [Ktedonobacterales bacterium]|nr:hypothetical protein [Ktedonobacterales bacterium]